MAQAIQTPTTSRFIQPLSSLIRDPFVRAAFERAERDHGDDTAMATAEPRPRTDSDRAAALVEA
jgi:hypothetical protein